MDPCLRLALLDTAYREPLVKEVMRLRGPAKQERYADLLELEVRADVTTARWTPSSTVYGAVPDAADHVLLDLTGIEAFRSLRLLHLPSAAVTDLAPLAALPALELLSVGVAPGTDLRPLLGCAALTRVDVGRGFAADPVLSALAERGVAVDPLLPAPDPAPFADPNLKLAVIDLLGLPLPVLEPFDEYAMDPGNLARVLSIPLSQDQLDSVERLHWMGGGYDIQHAVWSQWDGESDEFDIRTLDGIETLRNLTHLELTPLDILPEDQLTALTAAGVTVTEL